LSSLLLIQALKYFFHIAYKGNRYHGWQRQPNVLNVQEVIETALGRILKIPVTIMGCGRTDAQVHATQFFFHLEAEKDWDFDLLFRLNKLLPPDIAVFEIIPVKDSQHARFDAMHRTYDYFIHTYKDPFLSEGSALYLERNLNIAEMKKGADRFLHHKDFRAFCKSPDKYKHTICNISASTLFRDASGSKIRFQVSANRFLHSMVRTMVGALLEIGREKFTVGELDQCIIARELPEFIKPAYPQGLYLSKVNYRYLDIPARPEFSSVLQHAEEDWVVV
jgi:tRNA pseudouridine38-40 synthase